MRLLPNQIFNLNNYSNIALTFALRSHVHIMDKTVFQPSLWTQLMQFLIIRICNVQLHSASLLLLGILTGMFHRPSVLLCKEGNRTSTVCTYLLPVPTALRWVIHSEPLELECTERTLKLFVSQHWLWFYFKLMRWVSIPLLEEHFPRWWLQDNCVLLSQKKCLER